MSMYIYRVKHIFAKLGSYVRKIERSSLCIKDRLNLGTWYPLSHWQLTVSLQGKVFFLYLCLKTSYKCFIAVSEISQQFLHAELQTFHHTNSGQNRECMNQIYKWGNKLTEISLIKLHQTVKSDHNTFRPSRDAPRGDNACQVLWSSYLLSARDGPKKGSLKSQNKTKIGERGQPAVWFDFCQFFYQRLIGRLISSKNNSFR